MPSRTLLALAALLPAFALSAHAQSAQAPSTYAVLSLIGDQLDAVTYQPATGTLLDANDHHAMPMGAGGMLDTAALRETNKALRAAVPVADVALLASAEPALYADESRLFAGNQVKLPPDLEAAISQAKADRLVLITKRRADAHLKSKHGVVGSGKIEGLGFYIDTVHRIRDEDHTDRTVGFLAPFVYADVTLVDTATHTIVRQASITASETITSGSNATGASAWGALTPEQKMTTLNRLLAAGIDEAIPQLVRGTPLAPQAADATTR